MAIPLSERIDSLTKESNYLDPLHLDSVEKLLKESREVSDKNSETRLLLIKGNSQSLKEVMKEKERNSSLLVMIDME